MILKSGFSDFYTVVGAKDYLAETLQEIYNNMIESAQFFIDISRAIGGIGALFYISFRVWKHMANAEPINFFPLLSPFVICLCIILFPQVIDIINGILYQIIMASEGIGRKNINLEFECNMDGGIGNILSCALKKTFALIFEAFLEAVKIGVNVVRVFFLIILVIMGPIAFGLSIFDGFEGNLTSWIKRYISIYLWLPILNILQFICVELITILKDNGTIKSDPSFFIVVVYTIVCLYSFLKVPEISGWIVEAPGGFEREWGSKGAGFVMNNVKEAIKGVASKGKKITM